MRTSFLWIALILAAFCVALYAYLSGGLTQQAPASNSQIPSISFSPIITGEHAPVDRRVNYVASSADGFKQLWTLLKTTDTPPVVDLTRHDVIAVFAGKEPTGGYSIQVSKVVDTPTERTVVVTLITPGTNCVKTQGITTPFQILILPKTNLALTHKDVVQTANCAK
jgi:hypothetical protein